MLRKIGSSLLGAAVLVSTGFAAANSFDELAMAHDIHVVLPAKVAKSFYNFTLWKLTAACVMTSEDESSELEVVGLFKNGAVDGHPITKGTTLKINLHPNQVLTVMAEPGSQVQLTNGGPHVMHAHCTLLSKE